MVFGLTPWDKVPIHEAIRASCALPPVFTPAIIQERSFLDGQITKTCNLELVIKRGCNLVFIIDPLVPYTPSDMGEVEALGGVFTLIQTIKTLVHTRFRIFLRHITERFPQVDFIVLQPLEECAKAMAGSPMKYRLNPHLIELAYKTTLSRLRERHTIYEVKMEKHGFCLASPRELLEWERTGLAL
jgi:predicted acylesterase/phospholipase RssA